MNAQSRPRTDFRTIWIPSLAAIHRSGEGSRVLEIVERDEKILENSNGERTIKMLTQMIGISESELADRLQKLSDFIEIIPEKTKQDRLIFEAIKMRAQWNAAHPENPDNVAFHAGEIENADHQFDEVETSVSHIFRRPHPALGSLSYGAAFCQTLTKAEMLRPNCRVIEVGCGVGYFANEFLHFLKTNHPEIYASIHYVLFDLSPELQASQKRICHEHGDVIHFRHGNIESPDFGDETFDLMISNEVIADLRVGKIRLENIATGTPKTEAEQLAAQYKLDCRADYAGKNAAIALNTGAIRFLETARTILTPGGAFVFTEYGHPDVNPRAVNLTNHTEYSIHFGHLMQVAEQLGFNAELTNLGDFLRCDGAHPMLHLDSFDSINRALLPELNHDPLPRLAYDSALLETETDGLSQQMKNLKFEPLRNSTSLSPFRFFAMVVRAD